MTEDSTNAEKYHQTQAQLEAIEQEIKATQPLTSELRPMEQTLKPLYDDSTTAQSDASSNKYFLLGIDALVKKDYSQIRQTRGDGNCYYRCFLYNLCEQLLTNATERERVTKYVKESNELVTSIGGYEEMAIEIFYDTLVEFLELLTDVTAMHTELTEENATSDYCTWYLRVLTATYLKADPDRFLPYLEDGYMDIYAFCQQQIEPMGKECSMVQVLALAEAFQIKVEIEYLDGHEFSTDLVKHSFGPDTAATTISLLYRPGHYDILYPK